MNRIEIRSARPIAFACGVVLCAIGASGCEPAGDGSPLAPARGSVYHRGQPLSDAVVTFAPVGGERIAVGRTDARGDFELSTFRPGDGAWIGSHRVSIQARGPDRPLSAEETNALGGEIRTLPGDPRIPERYFTVDASGQTAEVTAEGPNDFRFDLAD